MLLLTQAALSVPSCHGLIVVAESVFIDVALYGGYLVEVGTDTRICELLQTYAALFPLYCDGTGSQ